MKVTPDSTTPEPPDLTGPAALQAGLNRALAASYVPGDDPAAGFRICREVVAAYLAGRQAQGQDQEKAR